MREEQPIMLALPRITRWMKALSIAVVAVWVGVVILAELGVNLEAYLALRGDAVLSSRPQVWRVVTYALIDSVDRWGSIVWTVLAFWLIGSPVERAKGPRMVFEVIAVGVLGGAVSALLASLISRTMREQSVMGMNAASAALVVGWGFVHARERVTFFGLGPMPGWHLALGVTGISVLLAVVSPNANGIASVGGAAFAAAWLWFRNRTPRKVTAVADEAFARAAKRSRDNLRVIRGGRNDDDNDKLRWN